MREPRSYIVRIYRRGYQSLSGIVEDTHTSGQRAFHSIQELFALLRTPIASNRPSGRRTQFRSTKRIRRQE